MCGRTRRCGSIRLVEVEPVGLLVETWEDDVVMAVDPGAVVY